MCVVVDITCHNRDCFEAHPGHSIIPGMLTNTATSSEAVKLSCSHHTLFFEPRCEKCNTVCVKNATLCACTDLRHRILIVLG